MNWLSLVGGLVGVIGLLYGLLERSKRQASDRKADTFFNSYHQEQKDHEATKLRLEELIERLKVEIRKLRSDLDAALPPNKLRDRLNDVLTRRVRTQSQGNAAASGVPNDSTPGDDPDKGSLGG